LAVRPLVTYFSNKPEAGDMVVLSNVPPGLRGRLPADDQRAIRDAVGKPVLLAGHDGDGSA